LKPFLRKYFIAQIRYVSQFFDSLTCLACFNCDDSIWFVSVFRRCYGAHTVDRIYLQECVTCVKRLCTKEPMHEDSQEIRQKLRNLFMEVFNKLTAGMYF